MSADDRWLLPDGIEEVLPDEARRVETMRRRVLDLFRTWGYERVMPPMVEFIDSLLTGVGNDMDLQTFKITDQISGRMMGIRPDMTPQAARIDAHYLKRTGPVRLCYLGAVLRTRQDEFGSSREPIQLGAELFGDDSHASEAEIVTLMMAMLDLFGVDGTHLELGHVGLFRSLAQAANLEAQQESQLFDAMQRKAAGEVRSMLATWQVDKTLTDLLEALVQLNGGPEVLAEAGKVFDQAPAETQRALNELRQLADVVGKRLPGRTINYDLAELSGYGYYTGAVFSVFVPGHGRAIAKGGRYDGIGQAFGRARPATGFSADLKHLLDLSDAGAEPLTGILAPEGEDEALEAEIATLRSQGERVVRRLPKQKNSDETGCDRQLVNEKGKWVVKPL